MLKNIWNNIILLNLNEFENIGINFYINIFMFALAVVICIVAVCYEVSCGIMFTTVKQLLRHEALSETSAKTLKNIGLSDKRLVRLALSRDSRLAKTVTRVGKPELTFEEFMKLDRKKKKKLESIDFNSAEFYISEDKLEYAKRVYSTYNISIMRIVLFCLLVFLIYGALSAVSYELLFFINSKLG